MDLFPAPTLRTERLLLRAWHEEDLAPFAALNADPVVMEFFPKTLDRAESDAIVERIRDLFVKHGFGLWATEVIGGAPFIGFVGLLVPRFKAHFTPCVEIGWRLAREHWGHGYATEAAQAVLEFGFRTAGLEEIVSMTSVPNERSQRVMQKLGMTHDPADDFDYHDLPREHPLCRHVLYRLKRDAWNRRTASHQ